MENTDKQGKKNVDYLKPYQWKKGQSGNIMGRPKGKTMKEYAKQYLERMTDEERDEWLEGLSKDIVWEMAEGKAPQALTGPQGEPLKFELVNYGQITNPLPVQTERLPD